MYGVGTCTVYNPYCIQQELYNTDERNCGDNPLQQFMRICTSRQCVTKNRTDSILGSWDHITTVKCYIC